MMNTMEDISKDQGMNLKHDRHTNIRILVEYNNDTTRSDICSLIKEQPEMEAAGETKNSESTIKRIEQLHPDVVLVEIDMPQSASVASIRRVTDTYSQVKIIALSPYPDTQIIMEAFNAGASGFLLKDFLFEDLEHSIYSALANKFYMNDTSIGFVLKNLLNKYPPSDVPDFLSLLTKKELKVFFSILQGASFINLAKEMNVPVNTVVVIRRQIVGLMVNLYSMKEYLS